MKRVTKLNLLHISWQQWLQISRNLQLRKHERSKVLLSCSCN